MSKIRVFDVKKNSYANANRDYIKYIATRPGVDLSPDYSMADDFVYTKYIAERPHSSGLFGNIDVSDYIDVSKQIYARSKANQIVYRAVVSLHPQDAVRLGYTDKDTWRLMVQASMPEIAKQFNIPLINLRWVAAYHREEGHPHVHIVFWSDRDEVKRAFIPVSKQHACRAIFSKEVYRAEREVLNTEKTLKRNMILGEVKRVLSETDPLDAIPEERLGQFLGRTTIDECERLSKQLMKIKEILPEKGRMFYQYMPSAVKAEIDKLTKEILKISNISKIVDDYIKAIEGIGKTYSSTDSWIKNMSQNAMDDVKKRVGNIILKKVGEIENYKVISIPDREEIKQAWKLINGEGGKMDKREGKQILNDLKNKGDSSAEESLNVLDNIEKNKAFDLAYQILRSVFSEFNKRQTENEKPIRNAQIKKKKKKMHMEELQL